MCSKVAPATVTSCIFSISTRCSRFSLAVSKTAGRHFGLSQRYNSFLLPSVTDEVDLEPLSMPPLLWANPLVSGVTSSTSDIMP